MDLVKIRQAIKVLLGKLLGSANDHPTRRPRTSDMPNLLPSFGRGGGSRVILGQLIDGDGWQRRPLVSRAFIGSFI